VRNDVVRATITVDGKHQFWAPVRLLIPEAIDLNFDMGDYVSGTLMQKV